MEANRTLGFVGLRKKNSFSLVWIIGKEAGDGFVSVRHRYEDRAPDS